MELPKGESSECVACLTQRNSGREKTQTKLFQLLNRDSQSSLPGFEHQRQGKARKKKEKESTSKAEWRVSCREGRREGRRVQEQENSL